MTTIARGRAQRSAAVRDALQERSEVARVRALIAVLTGEDLPAAMEALDVLAAKGPTVVPPLVSEMRRARNNWLIGSVLAKMGAEAVDPLVELLEGADEGTAVDCLYLLGGIQDRRAVPTLTRYLDDARPRVQMYAITSLLDIGGEKAVEAVIAMLGKNERTVDNFVIESLQRQGRRNTDVLLRNVAHPDPSVRASLAFVLGRLEEPRAFEAILQLLRDPEPKVRRNAAFALGDLAATAEYPEIGVTELTELLTDPSELVAATARQSLVKFGDAAVGPLIERCRSWTGGALLAGVNALRAIGSPRAEDLMIELLQHRERSVRIAAVASLMVVGTGKSVEPLLEALRYEDVRWFAALALERVGTERPDLLFTGPAADPTMVLRTQILVRLGPAIVPALVPYLNSGSSGQSVTALWLLGEIADPRAAPDVARLLEDPNLGWLAARTLPKLGEAGLEELLRYVGPWMTTTGAVQAVDSLALFDDPRALTALEKCVSLDVARPARIRAAVLLSARGDTGAVERLRGYLDGEGQDLWPEVRAALRQEGQIR